MEEEIAMLTAVLAEDDVHDIGTAQRAPAWRRRCCVACRRGISAPRPRRCGSRQERFMRAR
ncbi:hypothetical protein AB5I41_04315 [Sphingomonas sp. MMS24-JH45]